MTKPKPKAYRGVQSYLTEEQIRMLSKNPNIVEVTPRQVHYTSPQNTYPFALAIFIPYLSSKYLTCLQPSEHNNTAMSYFSFEA